MIKKIIIILAFLLVFVTGCENTGTVDRIDAIQIDTEGVQHSPHECVTLQQYQQTKRMAYAVRGFENITTYSQHGSLQITPYCELGLVSTDRLPCFPKSYRVMNTGKQPITFCWTSVIPEAKFRKEFVNQTIRMCYNEQTHLSTKLELRKKCEIISMYGFEFNGTIESPYVTIISDGTDKELYFDYNQTYEDLMNKEKESDPEDIYPNKYGGCTGVQVTGIASYKCG